MYTESNVPPGYFEFNFNLPGEFDHDKIQRVTPSQVIAFLKKKTSNPGAAFDTIVRKGMLKKGYGGITVAGVYIVFWSPDNRGFTT